MKYKFFLIFLIHSFSLTIYATYERIITIEEYKDWIIYKQNDDELFAARRICGEDSYFFVMDIYGRSYLNDCKARVIWEKLEELYHNSLVASDG